MRALSLFIGSIVVSVVAFTSSALGVGANAHVTRDDAASSYLRYDGSSDATMAACSTGRRSQNEPTVETNEGEAAHRPTKFRKAQGIALRRVTYWRLSDRRRGRRS